MNSISTIFVFLLFSAFRKITIQPSKIEVSIVTKLILPKNNCR